MSPTPGRRQARQDRHRRMENHRWERRDRTDDMVLSVIVGLQERQRQLQEQIMKLTMDKNNTLEYDAGNDTTATQGDDGEPPVQHLLTEGYPLGWRAPKLAMYEGLTDPEDHLHSFRTGMEDMTGQKDIWYRIFGYHQPFNVLRNIRQ